MKVLIDKQESTCSQHLELVRKRLFNPINDILQRYVITDLQDIFLLLEDPETFVAKQITGKTDFNISGTPITAKKALTLLEVPNDLEALMKEVNELESLNQALYYIQQHGKDAFQLKLNQLSFTQEAIEAIKESYCLYAQNKAQEQEFHLLNQIADLIDKTHYSQKLNSGGISRLEDLEKMFKISNDHINKAGRLKLTPKPDYIKSISE